MTHWWVNHKQTHTEEIEGGYIWSPKQNRDGSKNQTYLNLSRVQKGDVVFSYADTQIRAVGVVEAEAEDHPRPSAFGETGEQWSRQGWKVPVRWCVLERPFHPKDFIEDIAPLLPEKYAPIRPDGNGNQGCYLAEINDELGELLFTIASIENEGIRRKIKKEREDVLESATYLLTWKPERSPWRTIEEDVERLATNGALQARWSCGNTKKIEPGDRAFLLCQGSGPRGIIGSGTVVAAPYEEEHWNEDRAEQGDTALYVDVRFDTLVNPFEERPFERERLDRPPFDEMHWDVQASGTTIPPKVAQALEEAWTRWLSQRGEDTGGRSEEKEARTGRTYTEGRPQQVNTTRYERNQKAREECLCHYGYRCQVCEVKLTERYGAAAEELIHVHHRKPVAEVGEEYEVDPKEDLVPVCPNCHAVIHQRRPPYMIEEVRAMIENRSGRGNRVGQ